MKPLDQLEKEVQDMTTATHEYTGMTLELVDKSQVLELIKKAKEQS